MLGMSNSDGTGRSRRETPIAVTHGRAARLLVAPVQEKLGTWQAEAVKLEVMADRLKTAGRRDPSVADGVRALLKVVNMQAQLLETEAAEAPPPVRTHTRVTDTQKVLGLLGVRLEAMLAALGERPDKAR